jgi:hypothetical protein
VYSHREQGAYSALYEGEGAIDFSRKHLNIAQAELRLKIREVLESYAALLIYLASLDDVVSWRTDILRAASETMAIDPEDPDLEGKEIWSAIVTINAWLDRLASGCRWRAYATRYVLQNRLQLVVALLLGMLGRLLFDALSFLILSTALATVGMTVSGVAEHSDRRGPQRALRSGWTPGCCLRYSLSTWVRRPQRAAEPSRWSGHASRAAHRPDRYTAAKRDSVSDD